MNIIEVLAKEFGLKQSQVEQTVNLIDEGNTIPFIARYRKEATGGLSDVVLRDLDERLTYLRNLEERKEEVIRLIEEQDKLTDELAEEIRKAEVLQRVEDLYKPYKKKKATRASKAREKGLAPLAEILWAQKEESGSPLDAAKDFADADKGVESAEEALQGACDIIAERISDDPELTAAVREKTEHTGIIRTEAVDSEEKTVYEMYYDHSEGIDKIPNHRILAINRGEKEKKLKVKVVTDAEKMENLLSDSIITNEKSIYKELLGDTVADAYKRLMAPSAEREMRNMLTERAEKEAVKVFAKNTEKLLMVPGADTGFIDPNSGIRLHHAAAHERVHIVVFVGFLQYAQRTFAVRLVRVPHRNRVDMLSHVGTSSVLSCFSLGRSNSPSRPKCSRNLSVVVYRIGRPSVSRRPDS